MVNWYWCKAALSDFNSLFPSCPLLFSTPSSTYCFLRPLSTKNAFANHNQAFNNSSYKHWESSTVDQHSKIYICSATQQQSQQVAQNATLQLRNESGFRLRLLPFYGCYDLMSHGKKIWWRTAESERTEPADEKEDWWMEKAKKENEERWLDAEERKTLSFFFFLQSSLSWGLTPGDDKDSWSLLL